MKNVLKSVLFISIALTQAFSFAMEKEKIQEQQPFEFFELPEELNIEIFKSFIWDLFKVPRSFNELKDELLNLRLSSKRVNNQLDKLFTEKFVNDLTQAINEYSAYPISSYQLAKILLKKDKFKEYEQKHEADANRLGEEALTAIFNSNSGHTMNQDPNLEKLATKIKSLIKAGANLDYRDISFSKTMLGANILNIAMCVTLNMQELTLQGANEILRILINGGANLELETGGTKSYSALQQATHLKLTDFIKILKSAGAKH